MSHEFQPKDQRPNICEKCGKSRDAHREHGERGPKCINCGGYQTWCSLCMVWSSTCCVDFGTCQCS